MTPSKDIQTLIKAGALFVINDSGGKDSQAMKLYVQSIVPNNQIVIVHAHLPEVEWDGTIDHIKRYSNGTPVYVVQAKKTFFEMVDHRKQWPSPKNRQCTSDLKRGPIAKQIRALMAKWNSPYVVNCIGLRADESPGRAKKEAFKFNQSNSTRSRVWYDWLPIHTLTKEDVYITISEAGQELHWAYKEGMTRLSCSFCIMASKEDLCTAARLRPELFTKYVAKEKEIDHTFLMPSAKNGRRFLDEIIEEGGRAS